jgi:hypothetical protein
MTKEDAYRRYAVQCVEFARRATSVADRALLRKMAEVWVDLANLTHKQSEQRVRNIGEHPLVRTKLGAQQTA